MHKKIQAAVEHFLKQLEPYDHIVTGFSGGLDSTVLLHILTSLFPDQPDRMMAVHINHGLQPGAGVWAKFCREEAERLGVPFRLFELNLGRKLSNIEAKARQARYESFFSIMSEQDVLLTAHHQDDQAETFLLNLMRGSGVDGLSAMPPVQEAETGRLARPLLAFSRQDLQAYAEHYDLQWMNDPSNADLRFERNFVRNKVIPLLAYRWPHAVSAIVQSADHCRETRQFVEQQLSAMLIADTRLPHRLPIRQLEPMDNYQRQLAIRYWLRQLAVTLPGQVIVEKLAVQLDEVDHNAACLAEWSGLKIYRHADYLWLVKPFDRALFDCVLAIQASQQQLNIEMPYPAGTLQLVFDDEQDLAAKSLAVSFREAGQTLRLAGRQGTRSLKKLLQEWQVPAWMRGCVPILSIDGNSLAVADLAWCELPGASGNPLKSVIWQPEADFEWRDDAPPLRQKEQ